MNQMTRWNPISEFEDLLDRYNRYFGVTRPGTNSERESKDLFRRSDWAPAVDIRETDSAFRIDAELPGLSREDVKVTVNEGVLSIQGERQRNEESSDDRVHRVERTYGSFLRRFTLPDNVDQSSIEASFRDGILSLTLKKAEPPEPKAIEVEVH